MRESTLPEETGLPIVTYGTKSLGWLGMAFLLAVLAWVFLTLFYTYFYLRLYSPVWPQEGLPRPGVLLPAITFALLLVAGLVAGFGWRMFRREGRWSFRFAMASCCVLAVVFYALRLVEQFGLPFSWQTNAYGSIFFMLGWSLDAIVFIGLMLAGTALVRSLLITEDWPFFLGLHAQLAAHFWIFTAVIGVLVYGTLYVSPYVL
jgi:cytochrome c oxidase subunit 3